MALECDQKLESVTEAYCRRAPCVPQQARAYHLAARAINGNSPRSVITFARFQQHPP